MSLRSKAGRALQRARSLARRPGHRSYAQCGEDSIARFVFDGLRVARPSYLDLGAHDPVRMSNTFLFYCAGSRGVCVEPDPALFRRLKRKRPRDTCLNVGVGLAKGSADFYLMTNPALNTFSQAEAERYQSYGKQTIEAVLPVPIVPINTLIREHFSAPPQFLSIDIEGLDLPILQQLDFAALRPLVLCAETLTYTEDRSDHKRADLIDFVLGNDYLLFADTYINTIFVDRAAWMRRP